MATSTKRASSKKAPPKRRGYVRKNQSQVNASAEMLEQPARPSKTAPKRPLAPKEVTKQRTVLFGKFKDVQFKEDGSLVVVL
jgi:hypothetical protein